MAKGEKLQGKPNFFIVGAPKCGTTALSQYLGAHPQIFMPQIKELHYFGSDLEFRAPLVIKRRDRDVYLSYFAGWKGELRVGEASVYYLPSKMAAQEIHAFAPAARIIIMLRNPVDMMYSMYYQMLSTGEEILPSFEQALEAEKHRKLGRDIPPNTNWVGGLYYRELAHYTEQVKRYFDVFGRERVHIIIFDDFKSDTARVYAETLAFLGVDTGFQPEFPVVNSSKTVRNPVLRDFLTFPPNWYQALLAVGKKTVPASLRGWANKKIKSFNTIPIKRPPMNPDTRQMLVAEFRDEVAALSALLERDLSHWSRGEKE